MTTTNLFPLPEHKRILTMTSDNMEPTLNAGDCFIADYSDVEPAEALFYVEHSDFTGVYRVEALGDGVLLLSDNAAYEVQVPLEELEVFARVTHLINTSQL